MKRTAILILTLINLSILMLGVGVIAVDDTTTGDLHVTSKVCFGPNDEVCMRFTPPNSLMFDGSPVGVEMHFIPPIGGPQGPVARFEAREEGNSPWACWTAKMPGEPFPQHLRDWCLYSTIEGTKSRLMIRDPLSFARFGIGEDSTIYLRPGEMKMKAMGGDGMLFQTDNWPVTHPTFIAIAPKGTNSSSTVMMYREDPIANPSAPWAGLINDNGCLKACGESGAIVTLVC